MNCRTCGYGLWNLKARTCPECGTPFRPSEYDFTPNAVRYCCPHCQQAYYGTDERGHLVPRSFACVRCARTIDMDECVLLPAEGVSEAQTAGVEIPWTVRGRKGVGFLRGLFRTIGMAMVLPHHLGRALEPGGTGDAGRSAGVFSSILFAFFVALLISLPQAATMGVFMALPMTMAMGQGGSGALRTLAMGAAWICGYLVLGALMLVAFSLLWGVAAHVVLLVTGGTGERGGFGRTLKAVNFAGGANVLTAIPCLGQYFGWIWWVVSATIAVKRAHGVSGWRASLAVIGPPVLLIGGAIAFFIFLFSSLMAQTSAWSHAAGMPAMPATVIMETRTVADALRGRIEDNLVAGADELAPAHAAGLLGVSPLDPWDFVTSDSDTYASNIPLGAGTLDDLDGASPERIRRAVEAAGLPADVVAHRVGDFVFTYHGMDFSRGVETGGDEDDLWVVIASPDPDMNSTSPFFDGAPAFLVVAERDGDVRDIPDNLWAGELAQQNARRARFGLAPLPGPETVRHGAPGVSAGSAP